MRQNSGLGGSDPRDTEIHVMPVDDVDEFEDTSLDAPIGTVTTAATDSPADKEIEASRVEIEHTRAEISETIEAIKERLSPENLKEQAKEHVLDMKEHAKEQVKEATVDKAKEVMHTVQETSQQVIHTASDSVRNAWDKANESGATDKVKQNALPLAMTGVGLGWLIMRLRGQEQHHNPPNHYYHRSGTLPEPTPVTSTYGHLPITGEVRMSTNTPYEYHTPGTTYQNETPGSTYQSTTPGSSYHVPESTTPRMPEQRYDAGRIQHERSGHNSTPNMDMDTIKQNALPLAAAGLSLGWLFMSMKGQNQHQPQNTYRQPHDQHGVTDRVHDVVGGAQEKVGHVAGQVKEHVSNLGGTVKDQVSNLGEHASNLGGTVKEGASHLTETVVDGASHLTETVKDQAGHLTETVKDQASQISEKVKDQVGNLSEKTRQTSQRASEGFRETVERTPLAVAAVMVGLGAAAGLMTPETQPEKKVMGNAGDQILDKTRQTTQELLHKVENVARNTFETVKDTAMESMQNVKETTTETVKNESKSEGLTS